MQVIMGRKADGTYLEIGVDNSGYLIISASGGGGELTDAQLRATPVPVSGTITATPPTQAITRLRISKSAIGDNVIVAAPEADLCIYYELLKFQNNSDVAMTALVKFGAGDTNGDPTYMEAKGHGYVDAPVRGYVKLPAATALIINLDVNAKEIVGHLRYWIAA